jgi:uncharacterized protein DUF4184
MLQGGLCRAACALQPNNKLGGHKLPSAHMPLTVSHPAATSLVWPLIRHNRLPLAAVVVGTMVPDFEYFAHLRPLALWSHSLLGLFGLCLPLGMSVLALWEFVVCDPVRDLIGLAPRPTAPPRGLPWWGAAVASILLGAATHLVWDGLTHAGGWGTAVFPGLGHPIVSVRGRAFTWAVLLDYGSTLVGAAIILVWLVQYARANGGAAHSIASSLRWRSLVLVALGVTALTAGVLNAFSQRSGNGYWGAELAVARAAIGAMLALAVGLLLFACVHRAAHRRVGAPAT